MTYEEFRKRKESTRVTSLPLASAKSRGSQTEKAKIQVGIKEFQESAASLKILKGRTLPIVVNASINASRLLEEALAKHSKHVRTFNGEINEYVLLYPDNTVVNLLPGSSQFFSLKDYKEDLGKPYSKSSLHLCKLECLQKFEAELKLSDDDSLADPEGNINLTSHGQGDSECKISSVSVPSNTQSIIPFLSNAVASQDRVNNQSLEQKDVKMTCPTCYLDFSVSEIETHADACAEQFDPVGTVIIDLESETQDNQDELVSEQISAPDSAIK